jgi:bla regulator protein BlaR1
MIRKVLGTGLVCVGLAVGQVQVEGVGVVTRPGAVTAMAFESASIRQNKSEVKGTFGATPDGFRMTNMALEQVIVAAYVPQTAGAIFSEPVGSPAWLSKDRFDLEAKVSKADLADWQNPAKQTEMLRAMLQTMLVDRCKLVVHSELKDAPVYYLEMGKDKPKLTESQAGEPAVVSEGPMVIQFHQAPMTLLASYLTLLDQGGRPVQDRTGLSGQYDFTLQWQSTRGQTLTSGVSSDPGLALFSAVEALGLKLVAAKGQVETLVLDHVERPSTN